MKTYIQISVLILAFLNCVKLDPVMFNDCGSDYDLEEVDIEGCSQCPCVLNFGKRHNIHIKLYGREFNSKSFDQEVYLVLNSLHVPLPVNPGNLCTQIRCPVRIYQNASFSSVMDFTTTPPVQSAGILLWIIKNEKKESVMCMETRIKYEYPK